MISTEEYNELRFNQRMGIRCPTVLVHAALLITGAPESTRDLPGKLFLFRHMKAEVVIDSEKVADFARNWEGSGLLVSFGDHAVENEKILDYVQFHHAGSLLRQWNVTNTYFVRYKYGELRLVNQKRRSHVERILW